MLNECFSQLNTAEYLCHRPCVSCLTGHATAEDMVQHFNSEVINRGLTINNMVEVSMDGPNVNREFFDKMKVNLRENLHKSAQY